MGMPTAGASWIQECGAVAASLSLTSLFPHSGVIESVGSSGPVCPGTDSPASHNNNLATIIEDENKVGNSNIVGNKENEGYFDDNYAEENGRAIEIVEDRKEEAKTRRRRKKKTASSTSLASNTFHELYRLTGEMLGQGAYASVRTCVNIFTEVEYAVKIIDKGHPNIIQLIEYFEETERFYLIFEKVSGGQLLDHIQTRKYFTELEAANIIRDVASALEFLHSKGIADRDLKPE